MRIKESVYKDINRFPILKIDLQVQVRWGNYLSDDKSIIQSNGAPTNTKIGINDTKFSCTYGSLYFRRIERRLSDRINVQLSKKIWINTHWKYSNFTAKQFLETGHSVDTGKSFQVVIREKTTALLRGHSKLQVKFLSKIKWSWI